MITTNLSTRKIDLLLNYLIFVCSVDGGTALPTDTRRMHLDFDELSSSDEDMSKKKQREKRIRQEMAEHKSASRVMNTFENRYNAQMKMLKEQNRLLKGPSTMVIYISIPLPCFQINKE
jgi:hypothetical protein